MKKVILGGTFDIIHKGHEELLKKAFKLGNVIIGLTSDNFAQKMKGKIMNDFKIRKENLKRFLKEKFGNSPKIIKIEDIFGPTLKENFDYLVVSSETFKNAIKINQKRKSIGKNPLKIVVVKMVMAEDGKPISCTRIRQGEIDREGRMCVFCQIAKGVKKAMKVYEDQKFLAFLDIKPRNPGHVLVIPKAHFKWTWDIPYIDKFYKVIQKVANGIRKSMNTDWVISPVLGEEIPHAHVHLIPRFKRDGFCYTPPPIKTISEKEMKRIQQKIKKAI